MLGHGNGRIDTPFNYLATADLLFFHNFQRKFGPGHRFWSRLREHVEEGGSLLTIDSRQVLDESWVASSHPFLKWRFGAIRQGNRKTRPENWSFGADIRRFGDVAGETGFASDFYQGASLEPGIKGLVLVHNGSGRPGRSRWPGRSAREGSYSGVQFHPHFDPVGGAERRLLEGVMRWLAGAG